MYELKNMLIERVISIITDPICLILIIAIITMNIFIKIYDKKHSKNKEE